MEREMEAYNKMSAQHKKDTLSLLEQLKKEGETPKNKS